jgi:hypothetical protein
MSEASRTTLFKPSPRDKAENTTNVARSIMDAEVAAREKKTARLKELRLKHEAEVASLPVVEKPKPVRKVPALKAAKAPAAKTASKKK